jgi:xanthine/uracil/vitamin C permease (AzgA family)
MSYIAVVNPVFLAAAGIPREGAILTTLFASALATLLISHGLAAGFVSYAGMKLAAGKGRQAHWLVYTIALLFVWRYLALPPGGRAVPPLHDVGRAGHKIVVSPATW